MSKETSAEVASLAAKVLSGDHEPTAAEAKTLAASALTQTEPDKAAEVFIRLTDETALGQFIYDEFKLAFGPTEQRAFELGQAVKRFLTTGK